MATISRKEFADLCGITADMLRSYISRGKVVPYGGDGKQIDTSDPVNKIFREKTKSNRAKKEPFVDPDSLVPAINEKQGGNI